MYILIEMPRRIVRTRRYARRPLRRRQYGGKKTKPLKGFSRLQSSTIRRAIGHSEETKYSATTLCVNQGLDPAVHTPGVDIYPLVPKLALGTAENQRVGRKVNPTRCKVDVNASFVQTNIGGTAPTYQDYAQHIYVVMYIVRSKTMKNWQQWSGSTSWQNLLDNGDGTSGPFGYEITPTGSGAFWTAHSGYLNKPIETSEFTLVRKKIIKLTKNVGSLDAGVAGSAQVPVLPTASWRGSFSYKLPTLEWDDTNAAMGGYPTNANLMIMFGWCYADNLGAYYTASGDPLAPDSILSITATNHVFYKDG